MSKHLFRFGFWSLLKYRVTRTLRDFWQAHTRGFPDGDCWDLDRTICGLLAARLKVFREMSDGVPQEFFIAEEKDNCTSFLAAEAKWRCILNEMIHGFEIGADHKWPYGTLPCAAVQHAFDLLAQHHRHLWH